MFLTEPPAYAAPAQQSFTFEHAINVLSAELDRIHSGQLTLCAQVKDLRESLPMQRRPLSRWVQQIHVEVPQCEAWQSVPRLRINAGLR